jgi:arabinofuranosyltransferase
MRSFPLALIAATTVLTMAGVMIGHCAAGYPLIGIDDANIFLTYAQNLVRGWGFVYARPGKPVEGFTSLAWVLICAVATRVSGDRELVLLALNVGLVVLAVVSVSLFTRYVLTQAGGARGRHATLCATLVLPWCFLGPDYVVWMTLSLMDTALWGAVFTLGALATALTLDTGGAARRGRTTWLSLIGALALVTRPESMMLVPLWILVGAAGSYAMTGDRSRALARYLGPALVCAVTLVSLLAFRLAYFGYPLPNTYYAKVSPSLLYNILEGTKYLARFVVRHALVAPCLGCAVVATGPFFLRLRSPIEGRAARPSEVAEVRVAVVALIGMIGIALPVISGGDHFVQFRFYQPVWPILIVPPLFLVEGLAPRDRPAQLSRPGVIKWAGRLSIGLSLALGVYSSQRPKWHDLIRDRGTTVAREFEIARGGRETGTLLNHVLGDPPALSIGVIAAGGIAVTYRGETIDLLGLNDPEMGHSSGDRRGAKNHAAFNADVFFKQAPDLVMPSRYDRGQSVPSALLPGSIADSQYLKGLLSERLFQSRYTLATLALSDESEVIVACWVRRERVENLVRRGIKVRDLSRDFLAEK